MSDTPARPRYVPVSTYRLQVYQQFPLSAAAGVVPYLARLGVGACYTSPYFTAAAGSTHGYDVFNHNEINPELGGAAAHRTFVQAIAAHGLGHIVDFVPNHMGINAGGNAWWKDVLENGPSSPTAKFFDIDWAPLKTELHAKLLLPILGDQYGQVLERGELQLEFRDGGLVLNYFENALPVNPRQCPRVYRLAVEPLTAEIGPESSHLNEFLSILASLENMPAYTDQDPERIAERQREKEVARTRLARLVQDAPAVGPTHQRSRPDHQRHPRRAGILRCVTRVARSAGLPAVVLAHGVPRDQLSPLLRREYARGAARRGA